MRSLVLDRRLQNCSDEKLRDLMRELARIVVHHGVDDYTELPPAYARRYEALRAEFLLRGCQIRLF